MTSIDTIVAPKSTAQLAKIAFATPTSPGKRLGEIKVPPYKVLFLSIGDSARSLIAQALLKRTGGNRFRVWCASDDRKEVHLPVTQLLTSNRLWTDEQTHPIDQLVGASAPVMDFVISVGNKVSDQLWNGFPGTPIKAQWRIADPLATYGVPCDTETAFRRTFIALDNRVQLFALVWTRRVAGAFSPPDHGDLILGRKRKPASTS